MVFSSLPFIFGFLPLFFAIYYLVPSNKRNFVLLAGSLSFYFIGALDAPEHFILLLLSIIMDFYLGCLMEKYSKHKKVFLWLGVSLHVVSLAFFKYFNFVVGEINRFTDWDIGIKILLPMGISFYTFQGLSYLVDVYKGKVPAEKSLLRFSVYISMFEQLIAGPIVTYDQVRRNLGRRKVTKEKAIAGFETFVVGLGLKVLLANPLGKLFTQTQNIGFESISTPLAWMAIIAFSFQLYFDFYGYSIMAQGLGKMLGFNIPRNFNQPYLSCTMTEFWRRWHITLGGWFREYVYIPLGGNRKGTAATIVNLLIVWLLTGLWHGAGYNFILWGLTLAIVLMAEKFLYGKFFEKHRGLGHIYMLILIPVTWAMFAVEDMPQLMMFFSRLFPFGEQGFWSIFPGDYLKYLKLYYPFLIAGVLFSTPIPFNILKAVKNKYVQKGILAVIFLGCVYCMYKGMSDPFLYFRF